MSGEYQLLTPAGPSAIAVVRVRGTTTLDFLTHHVRTNRVPGTWSTGRVVRAALLDAAGDAIDDILVTVHGESPLDVRLHLHGNPWLVDGAIALLQSAGFEHADITAVSPWNCASRVEAEAFTGLPDMLTLRGAQWLSHQAVTLDAALRDIERDAAAAHGSAGATENARDVPAVVRERCRAILERRDRREWFAVPLRVALVGAPNAGKSTIANALARRPVSIVHETPGTTRDWIEIPAETDGLPVTWLDTAGLRETEDPLEVEGIRRTLARIADADATMLVIDAASDSRDEVTALIRLLGDASPACVALNKSDRVGDLVPLIGSLPPSWRDRCVAMAAIEGRGVEQAARTVLAAAGRRDPDLDRPAAFTARQADCLERACAAATLSDLRAAIAECRGAPSEETPAGRLGGD